MNKYEVVYANKYYLSNFIKNITLNDSLDEISFNAVIHLAYSDTLPAIKPGERIRISGTPYRTDVMKSFLYYGIVWTIDSDWIRNKELVLTVYDMSIFLKSEEEFIFQSGTSASTRFKKYIESCKLPVGTIENTQVLLSKKIYRAQPIMEMISEDLKETVDKGGKLYRAYMSPVGIELRRIGQNKDVWVFKTDEYTISELSQTRTLENMVNKVKVVGTAEDDKRSPVIKEEVGDTGIGIMQKMVIEETKKQGTKDELTGWQDTLAKLDEAGRYDEEIGLLKKIIQGGTEINNTVVASTITKNILRGVTETFTFSTIDVNTIRAGDKIRLNDMDLYVCAVKHEFGDTGRMTITAGSEDYIRRTYYA